MDPITFPLVHATNLPLGSQSEIDPRPDLIIDLTSEDNQPTSNNSNPGIPWPDMEDDDIIFTGENLPTALPPSNPTQASDAHRSNHSSSTTTHLHPPALSGRMATLTANIYAGYYSRNLRTNPPPQPSSSNITVRDSPPLQTRSPSTRTISFGGGGRFSGGRFSGFLAAGFNAGLNGLRNLANGSITGTYQQPEENLEQVFSSWRTNEFRRLDVEGRSQPNRFINPPIHGNFLALSPHEIFAAIYDFDHANQSRDPIQPCYKETDSHPLKIKPGFSKEIIPLDREVFSLDSDAQSDPLPEKQDLRPVCASCNEDLLMGQDSQLGSSNGRRPWILACGHVVDHECLEQARIRARGIQVGTQSKKEKAQTAASSMTPRSLLQTRGRPSKINSNNQTNEKSNDTKSYLPSNKRRKLSSNSNACNRNSSSPTTTPVSNTALKRKERADAREARKSAELNKFLHNVSDSKQNSSNSNIPLTDRTCTTSSPQNHAANRSDKGKGRAQEDETISSISIESQAVEVIEREAPRSTHTDANMPNDLSNSSLGAELKPSPINQKKNNQSTLVGAHVSWIKCPVKGCRANKGDILAAPGSKNAPWEMFV